MKIIRIKDYYGNYQEVPVEDALYDEWMDLQRETDRIRKREAYHRSGVPFDTAEETYTAVGESMEDLLVREEERDRLYRAIAQLDPIQQRRVQMFMDDMTYSDIARYEGCAFYAAHKSLTRAFNRLRKLLRE